MEEIIMLIAIRIMDLLISLLEMVLFKKFRRCFMSLITLRAKLQSYVEEEQAKREHVK